MSRLYTRTAAVLLLGLCVVAGLMTARSPEPAYRGKPLSYWLKGYCNLPSTLQFDGVPPAPRAPSWSEADEAIRAVGTNAIPTLLTMLQARDSRLYKMFAKSTFCTRIGLCRGEPASRQVVAASQAFVALSPEDKRSTAAVVVPALLKIGDRKLPDATREQVPRILGLFGPQGQEAVPFLLANLGHSNQVVRDNCFSALIKIHPQPDLIITTMTNALDNPDPHMRDHAAVVLEEYGPDAKAAVPALVAILRCLTSEQMAAVTAVVNRKSEVRKPGLTDMVFVAQALKKIDPEAAAGLGL